jgi:hypothetical protein
MQYGKCCFCESKILHITYGDVEHFRPKAGVRQRSGGPLESPGYYWLAYEWTNLFLCCQLCNQRYKENLFPLRRVSRRVRSHHGNLTDEEPLFVNPEEEPSRHIAFRQEVAFAVKRSRRGQTTIDAIGLNRSKLVEMRRECLSSLRCLLECRRFLSEEIRKAASAGVPPPQGFPQQAAKVDARLKELSADTAPYAAMVRAELAVTSPP